MHFFIWQRPFTKILLMECSQLFSLGLLLRYADENMLQKTCGISTKITISDRARKVKLLPPIEHQSVSTSVL